MNKDWDVMNNLYIGFLNEELLVHGATYRWKIISIQELKQLAFYMRWTNGMSLKGYIIKEYLA